MSSRLTAAIFPTACRAGELNVLMICFVCLRCRFTSFSAQTLPPRAVRIGLSRRTLLAPDDVETWCADGVSAADAPQHRLRASRYQAGEFLRGEIMSYEHRGSFRGLEKKMNPIQLLELD